MSLKTFTSVCLVVSIAAMMATGFLLVSRPGSNASRAQLKANAQRLVGAIGIGVASLVGAGVGSILLVRAVREEYRVASRRNLETLVGGLREDVAGQESLTGDASRRSDHDAI